MKIVLATSSFKLKGGGIASYNRELVKTFISKGHQIYVISADDFLENDYENCESLIVHNFPISISKREYCKTAEIIFSNICQYNPDAIISSDHILVASLFPCFSDKRVKMSISHFYNGIIAEAAAVSPLYTDWIISLSEIGKKWLINNGEVSEEQVNVIYNTVGVSKNVDDVIIQKSKDTVLRLVFPGGASYIKGADIVIHIMRYLQKKNFQWELIWFGSDRLPYGITYLRKFMPSLLKDKVRFLGMVTRKDAEMFIEKSHCLLLPSRGEGCPMTLLEAMRNGTIPLGSDCPSGMREIINSSGCGYVIRKNEPKGYIRAIEKMATNIEYRNELLTKTYKYYQEYLNSEIWYENMIKLLLTKRIIIGNDIDEKYDNSYLKMWHRHGYTIKKPLSYISSRIKISIEIWKIIRQGIFCRIS